jgi:hypothetical protein
MKPIPAMKVRPTALTIAFAPFLALAVNGLSPRTIQRAIVDKSASLPKSAVVDAYGKLPLSFELNQGQTDPRVKFLSHGSGYSLYLTGDEAVLALRKGTPTSKVPSRQAGRRWPISSLQRAAFRPAPTQQHGPETTAAVLRMRLVGANTKAKVTGLEGLPGKSNYFIGNDPKKWRTNVSNYARVKYTNVYRGVDLVYYGNQRQLEYDFVVQPGADLRRIRLAVQSRSAQSRSPSALRIDRDGDLVASVGAGEVKFQKPIVYQPGTTDLALNNEAGQGARSRHFVEGKYLLNGNRVSFEVASYDKTRMLVIDPTVAYSTYLGGSGSDGGSGVVVDASGDAFVTGTTDSLNFPTTAGAFQTTYGGSGLYGGDAFVAKLNISGSALLYSTYLGGSEGDRSFGIAVDASGNAYVSGSTFSSNFPTTPGAFQTTFGIGSYHAFISKLNAAGSLLLYSTYLGGSNYENAYSIEIDSLGDAFVTSSTSSFDFPTTPGAFQTTNKNNHGNGTVFVTKLNADGAALLCSTPPTSAEVSMTLAMA